MPNLLHQFESHESLPMIICPNAHFACLACLRQFKKVEERYNCPFCKAVYHTSQAIPFRRLLQLRNVRDTEKILHSEEANKLKSQLRRAEEIQRQNFDTISRLLSRLNTEKNQFIERRRQSQLQEQKFLNHQSNVLYQHVRRQLNGGPFHQSQKGILIDNIGQMRAKLMFEKPLTITQPAIYYRKQPKQMKKAQ